MTSPSSSSSAAPAATPASTSAALGDFTTDRRVLVLLAMAVVVGLGGLCSAWVLVKLIALITNALWFGRLDVATIPMAQAVRGPLMVAIPALGGLVIGLMARFGSEKIRGHGIPEAIEAILIGGSRMSPKVAILKPISSAISIGSGGPFGAEGPIIMTGGALGSLFAQFFHLSAAERKTLLVAGASAGMTAIFGTPLAAVMLAIELLLFEWKPRSFIPVAAAATVSMALRPFLFGSAPLFPAALQFDLPWWGLLLCAGMGAVSGLQSGLFTLVLYALEDGFERLHIHWMWWPAIGGLVVGLGGLVEPRALGVGYDMIADLISGHLVVTGVLVFLAVKAVIWLVALSSGTSGGVLAPLLLLGGALGWIVGLVLPGGSGLWALIGMAGMMGGTMRAPLTGCLFAAELTGDFNLLLPLFVAAVSAYAVTVLLLRRSILTEKVARRGQHVTREYGIDPFELMRASEIMVRDVATLPAEMPIAAATAFFADPAHTHRAYPVVDKNGILVGLVERADALTWRGSADLADQTLFDIVSDASVPVAQPGSTAGQVIDLMIAHDTGRVPVVESSGRLVGLIARKDLLRLRAAGTTSERQRQVFFPRPRRS